MGRDAFQGHGTEQAAEKHLVAMDSIIESILCWSFYPFPEGRYLCTKIRCWLLCRERDNTNLIYTRKIDLYRKN